ALVSPKLDIQNVDRFYNLMVFRDIRIRLDPAQLTALLRSRMQTYDVISGQTVRQEPSTIDYDNRTERSLLMSVTPDLLGIYGVRILRGRRFEQADVSAETTPVMLSDRLANRLSPDKPFPLDTAIYLEGARHPVIGIVKGGALVPGVNHP